MVADRLLALLPLAVLAGPVLGQDAPAEEVPADEEAVPLVLERESTPRELELALGSDHAALAYRAPYSSRPADGFWQAELLATERDDFLVGASILRWGALDESAAWSFGVGLSAWGGVLDGPPDGVLAVALTGSAAHRLRTKFPLSVSARVSFAPSVTSFQDAEGLTDAQVRLEAAVDDDALAFVGYRFFELDLDTGGDAELVDELFVGVRLGI